MATRLKTVHYGFTTVASVVNNTLTNLPQLTVNLPESGTKTFKSVLLTVSFDDIITATGGSVSTKTLNLRLGAAAYTSIQNANVINNSGENVSFHWSQDFTSHFTTNWSGTSMTCDAQVQINQTTGTTLGVVNFSATLEITYEYDDTSPTQIKTVFIPLNAPVNTIATTATTYDTIPILDTYLPESTKVYRNIHLIIQGNESRNAATTDHTMTLRVGAVSVATAIYEGALASDRYYRYVWNLTETYPNTATTQTFQPTATIARCNHFQAYLVVTYEYREDLSTSIMNSLILPMEVDSSFGSNTATDYQRATRDLWIQEPGTIVTNRVAFFAYWTQVTAVNPLSLRIGNGSFITYSDTANVMCGNNACMVRNDTAFTLVRGKNTLNFDGYTSDTSDFGWNISGFWIVNYTSSKSINGSGSHNHTVFKTIFGHGTAGAAIKTVSSSVDMGIPELNYFITGVGTRNIYMSQSISPSNGLIINVERLVSEDGIKWENAYCDIQQTDPEVGVFITYSQVREIFKRFSDDNHSTFKRIDLETARRWTVQTTPSSAGSTVPGWCCLSILTTYHSIGYTVSGEISGGFTGTVKVELIRESTGEKLQELTRTGDGPYSFTWYDDTIPVLVLVSDTSKDASSYPGLAGSVFNIEAPSSGSSGPTYFAG